MPTTPLLPLPHPQVGITCPGLSSSSSGGSCTPLQLAGTMPPPHCRAGDGTSPTGDWEQGSHFCVSGVC